MFFVNRELAPQRSRYYRDCDEEMRTIRKDLMQKEVMSSIEQQTTDRNARPMSPCSLICTLDDDKQCLGCGRTLAQISGWALMSVAEQWAVIDDLAARIGINDATIAPENGD
jgi:predicted Fe-S protein YdhL (DUF1289 family)